MGGIISSLQFLSFKIDHLHLDAVNTVATLAKDIIPNESWKISIGIRQPSYLVEDRAYIGGINIKMFAGDETTPDIRLEAGISGLFQLVGDDLPADTEEKLAKQQIPALLSPYLRATITGALALSGFGGVVLPLINFNELAKEQLKDVAINRIE